MANWARWMGFFGAVVVLVLVVAWLGLQVAPSPFPAYSQEQAKLETIPLPEGLPAPVERYYRKVYGERVPIITSAVITGRARVRPIPNGPNFPARFRFTHLAGKDYRHYIEVTFFGWPIMKVNESYLDGEDRQEMPWGKVEKDPQADQAGNLGLWAESIWLPAIFLTDSRVRWQALDEGSAVLIVPFGRAFERFVVRFDPDTGLVRWLESMRYKAAGQKVLWLNQSLEYRSIDGYLLGAVGTATWIDDGRPWAVFTVENVVYNADVDASVRAKGL